MTDHGSTPWPMAGDTAFVGGVNFDDIDLGWLRLSAKDGDLADGFMLIADVAVCALESGVVRSPERLFFAVAYAYRHSIELSLKTLIRHGRALELIKEPLDNLLGGHDLGGLWKWARQALERFFEGDDPAPLLATERVVLEFYTIDRSGQEFRYARDKRNRPHLSKAPAHANLAELKRVMAGVGKFLECCSMALSAAVDHNEEMNRAYQDDMKREYEDDMRREYEAEWAREQEHGW